MADQTAAIELAEAPQRAGNLTISLVVTVLAALLSIPFAPSLLHWFMLPVMACGVVIGADAVRWFRGQCDTFDPKGILGILGFHLFFLAPMLTAASGYRTAWVAEPLDDYRPWLGVMGLANFVGLLLYQATERWASRRPYRRPTRVWLENPSRAMPVFLLVIGVAIAAQVFLLARQGIAMLVTWERREQALAGMGVFRLLGNALPILLLMCLTLLRGRAGRRSSFIAVAVLLGVFLVMQFLFGGLMGSRSATMLSLFWMAGIVHYFWRRVTRKTVLVGLAVLVVFAYVYDFYKRLGAEAWTRLRVEGLAKLAEVTQRDWRGLLIGDLSRADVQAYMAYVLVAKPHPYRYRWGNTYVGDFLVQFPRWIWLNRYNLEGVGESGLAGTDLLRGEGFFRSDVMYRRSYYVHGLAGQMMLNFGLLAIPLGFAAWGLLVGFLRRGLAHWSGGDTRFLLAPAMTIFVILFLVSDANNLFFFLIHRVAIMVVVVWLMSSRYGWAGAGAEQPG